MMAEGHAVHEQQAILSTTAVIFHTFCMENEKNLTPRGLGACQRDPIVQVGHGEAKFIFPLCNYRYILLPLLLDPSEYSLVQRPVPLHHQYAQRLLWRRGEGNHTYSFVGQPTDKNKLRRGLLRCIHDCLAFDDMAARRSCPTCGSFWRQPQLSLAEPDSHTKSGRESGDCQSDALDFLVLWLSVDLLCWTSWSCDCQSDALDFLVLWLSVWCVGLLGLVTVSLMHWTFWSCDCQSDVLNFLVLWLSVRCVELLGLVTVSPMCWTSWSCDCQSDVLDFVWSRDCQSICCVGLCGHVTVRLMCQTLWSCDRQSDGSNFVVLWLMC